MCLLLRLGVRKLRVNGSPRRDRGLRMLLTFPRNDLLGDEFTPGG